MKKRDARINEIVEILTHEVISSQEALTNRLKERGYKVTQATLSRDLKQLRSIKVANEDGGYRYVMTGASTWTAGEEESAKNAVKNKMPMVALKPESMRVSGNMIVFKTRSGYAGGLAYDLDSLNSRHILGTIAGADTVFVVVDINASNEEIAEDLRRVVPAEMVDECFLNTNNY
ncbi:MAG: hypothetical protein J1E63_10580 [Muribaculaceae bacterium]|nr:hypothetical protein [Muribaculaceae bacterium]